MEKVHCTVRGILNVRQDVGAVLDISYQPTPGETWEAVLSFLKKGRFALSFASPTGTVTLRDVTVSASITPGGLMIGLGQNEPSRLVLGPAWIERMDP